MAATQAACKNGHVASSKVVDVNRRLEMVEAGLMSAKHVDVDRFCRVCGAAVIVKCDECGAPLENPGWGSMAKPTDRPFCPRCGGPFPWATRGRTNQLVALLDGEELDGPTRLAAIEAINELATAEPEDEDQQVESASRLRRLVPGLWSFMEPVAQSVLTAGAKDRLGIS